jgi:hypothetical protein
MVCPSEKKGVTSIIAVAARAPRLPSSLRPARKKKRQKTADHPAAASRTTRSESPSRSVNARMVQAAAGGWSK